MDKYEEAEHRYRTRISLIETQLDTALTLLKLANTELSFGHFERIGELLSKARLAQLEAAHSLRDVNARDESMVREKQQALDEALSDIEHNKRRFEEEN